MNNIGHKGARGGNCTNRVYNSKFASVPVLMHAHDWVNKDNYFYN